ncbi:hypothetical protein ACSSS7_006127 [Eimeria intestinalis]
MTALRRDWMQEEKLVKYAEKATDELVQEALHEEIDMLRQAIQGRLASLKSMVYVESQKTRELVRMAQSWNEGREISASAAAALVASSRVSQPSELILSVVKADEKFLAKRFAKTLADKIYAIGFNLRQSTPSPPACLVASAREILETGRSVVLLLEAAKMKEEAKAVDSVCKMLSSDLAQSTTEPSQPRRSSSMSSLASAFSRLRRSKHGSHRPASQTPETASGESKDIGTLARSPAVGGTGEDGHEMWGDDLWDILAAAQQQLDLLSIPEAVSRTLKLENAISIYQAQQRLASELASARRDRYRWRKLREQAEKASNEEVRAHLQKEMKRLQQSFEERKELLKLMGYVETQEIRVLVAMAQFWVRANEVSQAAAAALVASSRVTQKSKVVSRVIEKGEKVMVRRFVGILFNRALILSFKVQSNTSHASPSEALVGRTKEFLDTGRGVVKLLLAARMKKEAHDVERACNMLISDLDSSTGEPSQARSSPPKPLLTSGFSRFHLSLRRLPPENSLTESFRRHSYHGRPPETDSGVDGSFPQAPTPTASSPVTFSVPEDLVFKDSEPEDEEPEPLLTGHPDLEKLEMWTDEAREKLLLTDQQTMTSDEAEALELLWIEGSRHFVKVESVITSSGSDEDAYKNKVVKSCKYFLSEIPILLSPYWIQQLSESKRRLEKSRGLFKEALMEMSPDSAPPAGSSVFQNMMQLRNSVASVISLIARLKPFYTTPHSSVYLISMIAGGLGEAALDSEEEFKAAGARIATAWSVKLSAVMPTAQPQPATPEGGLQFATQIRSVTSQAAAVLEELLKAGVELPEVQQLEAGVKAGEAAAAL